MEAIEEKKSTKLVGKETGSMIKRLVPLFEADIPVPIQAESSKLYSGGLDSNGQTLRGLTPEEEKEFLSGVIGATKDSPNWGSALLDYWENFDERIPYGGLRLECGKDSYGRPYNLKHYCLAGIAEKDTTVAITDDPKEAPMGIQYILIDESKQKEKEAVVNDARKDADREFVKLIDSDKAEIMMRHLLIANNKGLNLPIVVIIEYDANTLEIETRKFKESKPQKFINDVRNVNLEYIATIHLATEHGLLTLIPHTDQYYKQDELLGTMSQAVKRLKEKSSMYAELIADITAIEAKQKRS